jgi:hypothetical protein
MKGHDGGGNGVWSRMIRVTALLSIATVGVGCGASQPKTTGPVVGAIDASAVVLDAAIERQLASSPAEAQTRTSEPVPRALEAGAGRPDAAIERQFAHTALEAQTMIDAQIEARMTALRKCVDDYRRATGQPHRGVTVNVAIDQEGHLIGVTAPDPKHGDLDPVLKACLFDSLRAALFPRSHTGVISVRQKFEDVPVTP